MTNADNWADFLNPDEDPEEEHDGADIEDFVEIPTKRYDKD